MLGWASASRASTKLRTHILEAALAGSEPQTPGRKPHTLTPAQEQVRLLQQQLAQQDFELRLARAREEIALTLPRLVPDPAADADAAADAQASAAEKKTPPSKRRRGRPPKNPANRGSAPGKRKST